MTIDDIRPREDIPTLMIKNADPNELVISSPWRHKTQGRQDDLRRDEFASGRF